MKHTYQERVIIENLKQFFPGNQFSITITENELDVTWVGKATDEEVEQCLYQMAALGDWIFSEIVTQEKSGEIITINPGTRVRLQGNEI